MSKRSRRIKRQNRIRKLMGPKEPQKLHIKYQQMVGLKRPPQKDLPINEEDLTSIEIPGVTVLIAMQISRGNNEFKLPRIYLTDGQRFWILNSDYTPIPRTYYGRQHALIKPERTWIHNCKFIPVTNFSRGRIIEINRKIQQSLLA